MTKRDWWLGVAIVAAAICLHALLPRHEFSQVTGLRGVLVRVDRWTGRATMGVFRGGVWTAVNEPAPRLSILKSEPLSSLPPVGAEVVSAPPAPSDANVTKD